MFQDYLEPAAIVALFLLFAVDKILSILKTRGIDLKQMSEVLFALKDDHDKQLELAKGTESRIAEMHRAYKEDYLVTTRQIRELHAWHNVMDDENIPVWHVRKSLEQAMDRLSTNIEKQTDVLSQVHTGILLTSKDHATAHAQIITELRRIKNGK